MLFAFVFGVLHASLNGRPRVVISYFKLIPLGIAALCYQEILDYYNYKVNLEKQGSVTVE